ncbi:MAG: YggT family protein [Candidatus Pacebacteria bacterium]|nr:YggT family protein [Candidatus Paceibacterota bacterium]
MIYPVRSLLIGFVNFILGLIILILSLRFLFRFLSVNPEVPVVAWVYDLSQNLLWPLTGLVPNLNLDSITFDLTALIAMFVYAIIAQLLIALINLIFPLPHDEYFNGRKIEYH